MSLFKSNKIRTRVMEAIENRISQAETTYEEGCKNAEAQYRNDLKIAEARRDSEKCRLENTAVDSIVGKFFSK